MIWTKEQLEEMTRDDARRILQNEVYAVAVLVEDLAGIGKIRGNTQHIRHVIAEAAGAILADYWREEGERK